MFIGLGELRVGSRGQKVFSRIWYCRCADHCNCNMGQCVEERLLS